jgi:hypothetical protein
MFIHFFSVASQKQSPFSLSRGAEKSYRRFDFLVAVQWPRQWLFAVPYLLLMIGP